MKFIPNDKGFDSVEGKIPKRDAHIGVSHVVDDMYDVYIRQGDYIDIIGNFSKDELWTICFILTTQK